MKRNKYQIRISQATFSQAEAMQIRAAFETQEGITDSGIWQFFGDTFVAWATFPANSKMRQSQMAAGMEIERI